MATNPPTYIPIILPPRIRLAYLTSEIAEKLKEQRFEMEKDDSGFLCVVFDAAEQKDYLNESLIDALLMLNQIGVVFGEDYKQLISPAGVMREYQREGILTTAFDSIAFGIEKLGDWQIKRNQPNKAVEATTDPPRS